MIFSLFRHVVHRGKSELLTLQVLYVSLRRTEQGRARQGRVGQARAGPGSDVGLACAPRPSVSFHHNQIRSTPVSLLLYRATQYIGLTMSGIIVDLITNADDNNDDPFVGVVCQSTEWGYPDLFLTERIIMQTNGLLSGE